MSDMEEKAAYDKQARIDALVYAAHTANKLVHEIRVAERRYADDPEQSRTLGWIKRMSEENANMLTYLARRAEEDEA